VVYIYTRIWFCILRIFGVLNFADFTVLQVGCTCTPASCKDAERKTKTSHRKTSYYDKKTTQRPTGGRSKGQEYPAPPSLDEEEASHGESLEGGGQAASGNRRYFRGCRGGVLLRLENSLQGGRQE